MRFLAASTDDDLRAIFSAGNRTDGLQGLAIIHSSLILLKSVTIAWNLADEFFHLIQHDPRRCFVDELLAILSETSDPDSHCFQGYELNHRRTHRCQPSTLAQLFKHEKETGHCLLELGSIFRRQPICRQANLVTTFPKPGCNI
jgi:hypothetical protein